MGFLQVGEIKKKVCGWNILWQNQLIGHLMNLVCHMRGTPWVHAGQKGLTGRLANGPAGQCRHQESWFNLGSMTV